jgi:hypothetical protein
MSAVHLLVSAGRGPVECAWAVAELVARLEAEAAAAGVPTGSAATRSRSSGPPAQRRRVADGSGLESAMNEG